MWNSGILCKPPVILSKTRVLALCMGEIRKHPLGLQLPQHICGPYVSSAEKQATEVKTPALKTQERKAKLAERQDIQILHHQIFIG